ncbi:testis-expressed protein 9 [Onthophagus taurus]|uniref:testis-expressed protein 9 n=1 Tax=Onthophagus taurus TaxID=166361 RepID=UPI000C209F0E|nr:testis-expressed protein 9 [Onthophagus taurus]
MGDLLQKEQEYRKLNDELENKTKELMQEVDVVMKIQDNLTKNPLVMEKVEFVPKHSKKFYQELSEYQQDKSEEISNSVTDNIPDSVNDMGTKGMNHFFRAKIRKMQSDFDRLQIEYRSKNEEFKRIQKDNQKLAEDKEKWFQISTGNKTQMHKMEAQISMLTSKLQSRENENVSLKKEIDQLQKELKNESANLANMEVKWKKASEDVEKHKAAYKNAKQEEKELRETHKKQISELSGVIKRIERHKMEILNGFKKQLLLINNLKKQKMHIESIKLTEKADEDFMKLLDWKIE